MIMQQQDAQVEQVGQVVRNLREIGQVMGNELDEQERWGFVLYLGLMTS